jgi:hypothetical protein
MVMLRPLAGKSVRSYAYMNQVYGIRFLSTRPMIPFASCEVGIAAAIINESSKISGRNKPMRLCRSQSSRPASYQAAPSPRAPHLKVTRSGRCLYPSTCSPQHHKDRSSRNTEMIGERTSKPILNVICVHGSVNSASAMSQSKVQSRDEYTPS